MSAGRGLPLLSGPPPPVPSNLHEASCRKCDKEFNLIFSRLRRCNHCGYAFCHSCTDYQALMPRTGNDSGYDSLPVCAFCIDNLNITAGGRGHLRTLPLSRLKKYANSYNVKIDGVLEKDELIEKLLAARTPHGCLSPGNEDYYRKHSVPNRASERPRGLFTRAMDAVGADRQPQEESFLRPPYQPRTRTTSQPSSFPRPDLDPNYQRQPREVPQHNYRTPPTQHPQSQPQSRNTSYTHPQYPPYPGQTPPFAAGPQTQSGPPPGRGFSSSSPQSQSNLNVPDASNRQSRPRSTSAPRSPRAASPPPPIPTLEQLIDVSPDSISKLSIGALKSILSTNHVNARLVVEKEELVTKVKALVEDERRERAEAIRRAIEEEQEMRAQMAGGSGSSPLPEGVLVEEILDDTTTGAEDTVAAEHDHTEDEVPPVPPPKSTSPSPAASPPKARTPVGRAERTGLCVICQDEEANIAIVDCGHLALCRACSELVMSSSRECPLCRTRIVTAARLLRIFKS